MPGVRLFALACLAALAMPACDFDLLDIGTVVDFSRSSDPELRAVDERMDDVDDEEAANAAFDQFLASTDTAHLEEAIRLQPDNPELRAMALVMAELDFENEEDAATLEDAKDDFLVRVVRSLTRPGEPCRDEGGVIPLPSCGYTPDPGEIEHRARFLISQAQEALLNKLHPTWITDPPTRSNLLAWRVFMQYCEDPARSNTGSCSEIQ